MTEEEMLVLFLKEDVGDGDLSSSIFAAKSISTGQFVAKGAGIVAGVDLIQKVYNAFSKEYGVGKKVTVEVKIADSELATGGSVIAEVKGSTQVLLSCERTILNLMQRMSGIATATAIARSELDDPKIQILDTRKTAPGLRQFDKCAVRIGGGNNHRMGLYDMVMLKDNHIDFFGSITDAVAATRKQLKRLGKTDVKIEVETRSAEQVKEAVVCNVDQIMFDNATPEKVKEFVKLVPKDIKTEASGGINLNNIATFSGCGVDYISLGFLTHSVQSLDISFQAQCVHGSSA
ncbi:MAG: carboxylating nicotinate-nucleotide diphosphorylase [Candidatus Ancillula sp.]|jgi:nicotinate-nucleotide pyrophosphorylase (carboxylating)|nr:carboxylating nicotinate-nucleotide diphosphorylase [Candidatus Ancillula sp.]